MAISTLHSSPCATAPLYDPRGISRTRGAGRTWHLCHLVTLLLLQVGVALAQPTQSSSQIATLQRLVETQPGNIDARLQLAQLLRQSPQEAAGAEALYRQVLVLQPGNALAQKGLAQVLKLPDNAKEAAELYDAVLLVYPRDVDVLLGRSQIARIDNDNDKAKELIDRALTIKPKDARLLAELAFFELQTDDKSKALEKLRQARAINPRLPVVRLAQRALDEATAPSAELLVGGSNDSTGFDIKSATLRFEKFLRPDTRLRLEPSFSQFQDDVSDINRPRIGVGLRQSLPYGIAANLVYRASFPDRIEVTHEVDGELGWTPFDWPLSIAVGQRRRAVVDNPAGNEDVGDLGSIGTGGTTVAAIRQRLQVTESVAGFVTTPAPGFYAYGEASIGEFSNGNQRESLVAGLGLDVFRNQEGFSEQSLTFKYDFFDTRFDDRNVEFFTPVRFQVHTVGIDYRYRRPGLYLAGFEAGYPIQSNGDTGYLVGGFASVRLANKLQLEARVRRLDDTQFKVTSVIIGPRLEL